MTFLYEDSKLIDRLLKAAEEFEKKFSKQGQATPATPQPLANLSALLGNLREQLNPSLAKPGDFNPTSKVALDSEHMDSLGDFVKWLDTSGRKDISVKVNPERTNRPSEEFWFCKIEPSTAIIVPMARPDRSPVAYWINPQALKQYLLTLQGDEKLKTNVIFQVQLLKLIQDANKQLDLDLSEQYKEPEKVLPDTTVLDSVPKDLDPQQWATPGPVQLTVGDLKNSAALNAWLSGKSISIKVNGRGLGFNHPEYDHCAILKILNQRVGFNASRATSVEGQQMAAAYGQKVKAIAAEIQCNLGDQPQQPGEKPGQPGQGGGLAAASPQILMQLSSLRPFNSQFISLQEISKFLELYGQYANDANVSQMISKLQFTINKFKSDTQMGSDTIQLYNLTTGQFKGMLKNPATAYTTAALLYDIVFYGGQLYQRLVTSLQTLANDPVRGKYIDYRAMQQQITPGGPQLTNVNDLNELMYTLKQEWNQK